MRKTYIDNIRFITVVLVVIYHVIYIFNGITVHGIIGPFAKSQPQDVYQYIVYPGSCSFCLSYRECQPGLN